MQYMYDTKFLPRFPTLPVLPILWTYSSMSLGKSKFTTWRTLGISNPLAATFKKDTCKCSIIHVICNLNTFFSAYSFVHCQKEKQKKKDPCRFMFRESKYSEISKSDTLEVLITVCQKLKMFQHSTSKFTSLFFIKVFIKGYIDRLHVKFMHLDVSKYSFLRWVKTNYYLIITINHGWTEWMLTYSCGNYNRPISTPEAG